MVSVEVKVGRLVEARVVTPGTINDVVQARERMEYIFKVSPGRIVGCADFTRATVFPQDVAAKVIELFRSDNPKVERTGILVSKSAVFSLQVERLITQANNPARRCFHDPFELKAYLGSLLSHEEHARLAQFLTEKV